MDKLVHTPGKWRQVIAAVTMSLSAWITGLAMGWTSSVTSDLQKPDNELEMEPLSDEHASWILSVEPLGSALSIPFGVSSCELLGRKPTAIIAVFVYTTSWLLKFFATNFPLLLAGQVLSGCGQGLILLMIPLYITEMASNSVRGQLGSLLMFGLKGGYLLGLIISALSSYKISTGFPIIILAIQLGGILLIPETPVYLIRKNRIDEAKRSLMWLRANKTRAVELELSQLQEFHKKIMQTKSSLGIIDLFINRVNLEGLLIGLTLLLIQQLSGISVMMSYIVIIFEKAEISVDPHIASIIYGSVHVSGSCISILAVDRFGRRPLLLMSTSGMAVSHIVLSVFLIMSNFGFDVTQFNWLPIFAIALFGLSYSMGIGPLSSVIANEVCNPEFASICNCIYVMLSSTISFTFVKIFPIFADAVGFHYSFLGFSVACVGGFFIILFIIPETKGRSIESIRDGLKEVDRGVDRAVELKSVTKLPMRKEDKQIIL